MRTPRIDTEWITVHNREWKKPFKVTPFGRFNSGIIVEDKSRAGVFAFWFGETLTQEEYDHYAPIALALANARLEDLS